MSQAIYDEILEIERLFKEDKVREANEKALSLGVNGFKDTVTIPGRRITQLTIQHDKETDRARKKEIRKEIAALQKIYKKYHPVCVAVHHLYQAFGYTTSLVDGLDNYYRKVVIPRGWKKVEKAKKLARKLI